MEQLKELRFNPDTDKPVAPSPPNPLLERRSAKAKVLVEEEVDGQTVESLAFGDIKSAIRTEELRLMHIEEERRYMVMRQQRKVMATSLRSTFPPPGSHQKPDSRQQRSDGGIHAHVDTMMSSSNKAVAWPGARSEGVSASFAWLANPRMLNLKQRNSTRAFEFKVVLGRELTHDALRNDMPGLAWTKNGQRAGFVLFGDMEQVKLGRDPLTFVISLKPRNPVSIMNTGGLREVSIRANSESECDKYLFGMQSLLSAVPS